MHSLKEIESAKYGIHQMKKTQYLELEGKLKDILQKDETAYEAFAERIGPTLKTEFVTLRQSLTYMLNSPNSVIEMGKLSARDFLNLIDDSAVIIIYHKHEYVVRKEKSVENEKRKCPDPEKATVGQWKLVEKNMVQLISDKI
uniref:DH domain-containing protein n=1 Tax=Brugia pahangi TaxID=6280 RepID=A0A0N4TYV7_BRUPA